MPRTRLAPSPTGALHLGNARTFLVNWALARQGGWSILLRIEDLDGPRVKAAAAQQAIDLLAWLGLDWDEGPLYQTRDLSPYLAALEILADAGQIYACRCTRRQIEEASLSAPHGDEHDLRYPGTCRPQVRTRTTFDRPGAVTLSTPGDVAWRLRVEDKETEFTDAVVGRHRANVQKSVGDFLVATKAGLPSYQLAVVVDDARQTIDSVVRGDDLLGSTHRQLHLYESLQLAPPSHYTHLPLVIGPDGRRLAKRHGDTRIDWYRNQGVSAERIVGLLAEWCGLGPRRPQSAVQFLEAFRMEQLPRDPIVFTQADDDWLRSDKD